MNQYALESIASMIPILKDGLNPVIVSVVTVVTDNLNSKHPGIYGAAVKVLDTMLINLGNGCFSVLHYCCMYFYLYRLPFTLLEVFNAGSYMHVSM